MHPSPLSHKRGGLGWRCFSLPSWLPLACRGLPSMGPQWRLRVMQSFVCLRLCHRVRWVSRREGVDAWNSSVGRHPLSSGGRGHNPPRCEQLVLFVLLLKAPLWGYRGPVCPSNSQLRLAAEAASWSPQEAQGTQHARSARPSKLLQSLHLPGHVTPSSCHRSHFIPRGADWQVEEALAL